MGRVADGVHEASGWAYVKRVGLKGARQAGSSVRWHDKVMSFVLCQASQSQDSSSCVGVQSRPPSQLQGLCPPKRATRQWTRNWYASCHVMGHLRVARVQCVAGWGGPDQTKRLPGSPWLCSPRAAWMEQFYPVQRSLVESQAASRGRLRPRTADRASDGWSRGQKEDAGAPAHGLSTVLLTDSRPRRATPSRRGKRCQRLAEFPRTR